MSSILVMHGSWNTEAHTKEFALFSLAVIHETAAACARFDLLNKDSTHVRINCRFESHLAENIHHSSLLGFWSIRCELSWSWLSSSERICCLRFRCEFCSFLSALYWMDKEAHRRLWADSEESHVWANVILSRHTARETRSWLLLCSCFDHFDYFWLK